MGSEPLRLEAARMLVALAAALLGLALAAIIGYRVRRGRENGTARFNAIMILLSAAVASGAAAFIAVARLGGAPAGSLVYGFVALAAGLLAGLFPRAAGIPVVAAALLALGVATASMVSWLPWTEGLAAARLEVYTATDAGTRGVLAVPVPRGRATQRDVELQPGPVTVVFEALDIRGPLSLIFGPSRFRVVSLRAGQDALDLRDRHAALFELRSGGAVSRALGLSSSSIEGEPFEPLDLSTATWRLGTAGTIRLEAPATY